MFSRFLLLAIFATLSSCTATMVSKPGAVDSKYAPLNETNRAGLIKYLNQGGDSVIDKRREDAYKKMYDACQGKYVINKEGPRTEGGVIVQSAPNIATHSSTQYWYISFSCK